VTVIVWSYLNTPWYAKQIRDLTTPCEQPGQAAIDRTRIICQREFDPATAPGLYGPAQYPTMSVLPIADHDIDGATQYGYIQLPQAVAFEARGIQTTFPAGTVLPAADQFILNILRNSWGDRPIYFASTTNSHRNLGLDRFVARQGVAYKLLTPEEAASPALLAMPQDSPFAPIFGAYLDVPRTEQLLSEVFIFRDLIDRPHWTEDATRGIPTYYAYAHVALAEALQRQGRAEDAQRHVRLYERWMDLAAR
jgi:hypothetical protein